MKPIHLGAWILLGAGIAACTAQPAAPADRVIAPWTADLNSAGTSTPSDQAAPTSTLPPLAGIAPTRIPGEPYPTPTPDAIRTPPPIRTETEQYVVKPGDNLSLIASLFGVSPALIAQSNGLLSPDWLPVWSSLTIPPPRLRPEGSTFKILPDSGLVYGPPAVFSNVESDLAPHAGYLSLYWEEVDGQVLSGSEIVQRVAEQYSVAPRMLLALLEHQSGWVTRRGPSESEQAYPLGYVNAANTGLHSQLSWAANLLNNGYYRWRAGWAGPFPLPDGSSVPAGPGINAATAAVQSFFAALLSYPEWEQAVQPGGFDQTYAALFGDPFAVELDPLVPPALQQPALQLPFESDKVWSFTGGPHSAWGSSSGWAALDFAPPGDALGCVLSDEWVTASANGLVLRSREGEVLLDLDGDGYEQTGWVLLYMHIESRDRVSVGSLLRAGDRIGHPSCEGGVSNGTHVHLARKYNGEWIPADGDLPFNLDGWISSGTGSPYDGRLERGDVRLEACSCRNDENQVGR